MSSASHSVLFLQFLRWRGTWTRPRYVARPVPTEIDLEMMLLLVSSAAWIILAPVSWCWPLLARAMERTSPRALRPFRTTPGYFIVRREPMLQSIHLTSASSWAMARLVTRLKTFADQFWTVTYWIFAPFIATSSTTAECSVAVSNFGAVRPSMYITSEPSSAMMRVRSNWPKFSALMRK